MDSVIITYFGHACFCLEYQGYRTVLDPYGDGSVPGLPNLHLEAEAVFCSHGHEDHHGVAGVKLCQAGEPPYTLEELETEHDDQGGNLRGANTVRIFHCGQLRIAHMGDIGRPLTQAELERIRGVDCMMLPVGGYFTIDAAQAKAMAEASQPRVLIPMHYRTAGSGYDVIGTLDEFLRQYPSYQEADCLELTKQTPPQLLVLRTK